MQLSQNERSLYLLHSFLPFCLSVNYIIAYYICVVLFIL